MRAVVITPTTGIPELAQTIQSVSRQCDGVQHWVVVDGMQYADKAIKIVQENAHDRLKLIILPENTGMPQNYFKTLDTGFYGHRIYGGIANFVNAECVMFLDEDNWFEDDHASHMLRAIQQHNLDWCYSLRNVVNPDGSFLCQDNCDSLGIFPNQEHVCFVDMNCYCFKTEFLIKLLDVFQIPSYCCDREVFKHAVARGNNNFGCTGRYTVNYRTNKDFQHDWFVGGNEKIKSMYNGHPWSIE